MTRKQAIFQAIQQLSKNNENEEICKKLQEIHDELPLSHWTEKSIHDSVQQFVIENNRLPTTKDFLKVNYLPSRCTIKNKLGIASEDFFKKYYSEYYCNNRSLYTYKKVQYWIDVFKEQYIKHGKPTINNFDLVRDKGTPCVQTYLKITNINSWNELLNYCGFEIKKYNNNSEEIIKKRREKYSVNIDFNENVSVDEIAKVNDFLEKIISNK